MRYYGSKLSENMAKTPEGFMICQNVPLARTGTQAYEGAEIGFEGEGMVTVHRLEEEVFSKATMASFEGRPVTNDHPNELLQRDNVGYYQRGHVQNVRRGQGEYAGYLLGDLFITHPDLIDAISQGKREVSCGYDCVYDQVNGKVYQRAIRGNHVAVVDKGRAGSRVAIKDHQPQRDLSAEAFDPGEEGPKPLADKIEEDGGNQAPLQGEKEEVNQMDFYQNKKRDQERQVTFDDELTQLLQEILALLQQLTQGQRNQGEETQDEDPMARLDEELEGIPPQGLSPRRAAQGAAELIEPEEEEEGLPMQDSGAVLSALAALKPTIAKLPQRQRQIMADAVSAQARLAKNLAPRPKTNQVSAFTRALKGQAFDQKTMDDREVGQKIMANRNPHYQNKGGH